MFRLNATCETLLGGQYAVLRSSASDNMISHNPIRKQEEARLSTRSHDKDNMLSAFAQNLPLALYGRGVVPSFASANTESFGHVDEAPESHAAAVALQNVVAVQS